MWFLEHACHEAFESDYWLNGDVLDLQFCKAAEESVFLEEGTLQEATWGHFTKSLLINILLGANCTSHESWMDTQQLLCLCQCVLIQYVQCLEIWTILCLSFLWYLLQRLGIPLSLFGWYMRAELAPTCQGISHVHVWDFFTVWTLKRKTASCPVHVKVRGASRITPRHPVLSVPYGLPPTPVCCIGCTVACKSHGTISSNISYSTPSHHHEEMWLKFITYTKCIEQKPPTQTTNKHRWEHV